MVAHVDLWQIFQSIYSRVLWPAVFRAGWISSGWAVLSRQLWDAEMLPWCRSVQVPSPVASLTVGLCSIKVSWETDLQSQRCSFTTLQHISCKTLHLLDDTGKNVTFQRSWVGACSRNHWYSLLLANSVSLFSSKAFPVNPICINHSVKWGKETFYQAAFVHFICLLIITQVR